MKWPKSYIVKNRCAKKLHIRILENQSHFPVKTEGFFSGSDRLDLLPQRLHPRLVALMRGAVPGRRGRSRSPASVARAARWPAIALEGGPDELVELTLGLVAALDRELAERQA